MYGEAAGENMKNAMFTLTVNTQQCSHLMCQISFMSKQYSEQYFDIVDD